MSTNMGLGWKSDYIGVRPVKMCTKNQVMKYRATITVNGNTMPLGVFATEREAAIRYDKEAIKYGRKTNILKPKKDESTN